jgi:hypothetical protein
MKHVWLVVLFACLGCDGMLYGVGSLYVYNGTDHAAEVQIEGRTPRTVRLRPNKGEMLDEAIAGTYTVSAGDKTAEVAVTKERLTLFNLDSAACFARLDVIGMYQSGKEPVRVLETYEGEQVMAIADLINVPPGSNLPSAAPKTSFPYQRLVVVPCHLLEDDAKAAGNVAEYARRLR